MSKYSTVEDLSKLFFLKEIIRSDPNTSLSSQEEIILTNFDHEVKKIINESATE